MLQTVIIGDFAEVIGVDLPPPFYNFGGDIGAEFPVVESDAAFSVERWGIGRDRGVL